MFGRPPAFTLLEKYTIQIRVQGGITVTLGDIQVLLENNLETIDDYAQAFDTNKEACCR